MSEVMERDHTDEEGEVEAHIAGRRKRRQEKGPRIKRVIETATKTVALTNKDGAVIRTYSWANLTPEAYEECAGLGFITKLGASYDPVKCYEHVQATGKFPPPGRKGRQPGTGAPSSDAAMWREAIAYALADMLARQAHVKPRPGQRLDQAPEYAMYLPKAQASVAKWDKAKIKAASGRTEVAAHYQRLAGTPSLLELWESNEAEDEAADVDGDEDQEAADVDGDEDQEAAN